MSDKYILRSGAIDAIKRNAGTLYAREAEFLFQKVISLLKNAPAADVAEVVHGEWETNSDRPDSLICSVCKCGFDMWKHDPHNYCPNCGARMDGWMEDADNG